MTDSRPINSIQRTVIVVAAHDQDSFTSAMRAAVKLVNEQEDSVARVELRTGRHRLPEWSVVLVQVGYDW